MQVVKFMDMEKDKTNKSIIKHPIYEGEYLKLRKRLEGKKYKSKLIIAIIKCAMPFDLQAVNIHPIEFRNINGKLYLNTKINLIPDPDEFIQELSWAMKEKNYKEFTKKRNA